MTARVLIFPSLLDLNGFSFLFLHNKLAAELDHAVYSFPGQMQEVIPMSCLVIVTLDTCH